MSEHVTDIHELAISLSAGPCNCCGERGRGVTFNSSRTGTVQARVGVHCGCWDSLLRLVGDCLVCDD